MGGREGERAGAQISVSGKHSSDADPQSAAPTTPLHAVLTVFLPFSAGYFLSYLFRNVNAVIAPRLIGDLGLSAGDLGLLTAAYFLTFAAFQIPLGILLDRFGPRRVQATLFLSAAAGAGVFALGESRDLLLLGRALIGLGVAGGLMASFKAITIWFPKERWPLVNGCFLASGGLGAIAATEPVELLLGLTDWRGLFLGLCVASVAVSVLIFAVVPEAPEAARTSRLREALAQLRRVYADRLFWRLAPLGVFCSATSMAVLGLWTGPWLKDVGGLAPDGVARTLLAGAAAMAAGSILTGGLADLLGRRGVSLEAVTGLGLLLFFLAQTLVIFGVDAGAAWPWILYGMSAPFSMLIYPRLSRHFPLSYAGRANTGVNVLVFTLAFTIQAAVGWVIDLWPAAESGGYPPAAYQAAFGAALAVQLAAYLWFLLAPRPKDAEQAFTA